MQLAARFFFGELHFFGSPDPLRPTLRLKFNGPIDQFQRVFRGAEGWNLPQIVRGMQRAMQFIAHKKKYFG
jgi:hypothetical protein